MGNTGGRAGGEKKNQEFGVGRPRPETPVDVPSREVRWAVEFMILEVSVEIRLGTTRGRYLKR